MIVCKGPRKILIKNVLPVLLASFLLSSVGINAQNSATTYNTQVMQQPPPSQYVPQAPAQPGSPISTARNYNSASNPLPMGSNAVNLPLTPGNERWDYQLKPYVKGQPLVLMAISGGGSRSAYYAASIMEQLSHVPMPNVQNQTLPDGRPMYSLLDAVRVISTVSAGGLASSWYINNFDRRKQPGFFDEMKSAVSVNLQWKTYGHMALFPPLAFQLLASSVTRTDLLADEIDRMLGDHDMTFNELRMKETREIDPCPVMLINGTGYNSGQRLVMTNLPGSRFPSLIGPSQPNVSMPQTERQVLHNLVQPLTFEDIGSDIGSYQVSKALASSAAYPIVLAPVPLRIYPNNIVPNPERRIDQKLLQSNIMYVADGGIYENEGIDALLSVVQTIDKDQTIMLIVVDGSARMETMNLQEGKIFGPLTVMGRMYDIGTLKPLAFYNNTLADYHDPKKLEVVYIRMEGYDRKSQSLIKSIPAQFKLEEDHRVALDKVAVENFAQMYDPMMRAYGRLAGRVGAAAAAAK